MYKELIQRDIYEISTKTSSIQGVKFRGRIRKLCLENNRNVLIENTQDVDGRVRFAVPTGEDIEIINSYVKNIIPDTEVSLIEKKIPNPVLSKLKTNITSRYNLYNE